VACKLTSLPIDGQTVISQAGRSLPSVSSGTHSASFEKQRKPNDDQRVGRDATPKMKVKSCKPKCKQQAKSQPEDGRTHVQAPSIQLIASRKLCLESSA
jgi:hypothetical protein